MTLNELFMENKGYLKTNSLHKNRKLQQELKEMLEKGEIECLKRGLYKHPEFAQLNHWQEISFIYPQAVFYFLSAAAYYNLTTYMPHTNHMAIERKRKITLATYPPVTLYYLSKDIFEQHTIIDDGVKIYTLERTVCDIIRLEKYAGKDVVKEVCNNYLLRHDKNIERLLKTAKDIKAYDKVYQIFSILI